MEALPGLHALVHGVDGGHFVLFAVWWLVWRPAVGCLCHWPRSADLRRHEAQHDGVPPLSWRLDIALPLVVLCIVVVLLAVGRLFCPQVREALASVAGGRVAGPLVGGISAGVPDDHSGPGVALGEAAAGAAGCHCLCGGLGGCGAGQLVGKQQYLVIDQKHRYGETDESSDEGGEFEQRAWAPRQGVAGHAACERRQQDEADVPPANVERHQHPHSEERHDEGTRQDECLRLLRDDWEVQLAGLCEALHSREAEPHRRTHRSKDIWYSVHDEAADDRLDGIVAKLRQNGRGEGNGSTKTRCALDDVSERPRNEHHLGNGMLVRQTLEHRNHPAHAFGFAHRPEEHDCPKDDADGGERVEKAIHDGGVQDIGVVVVDAPHEDEPYGVQQEGAEGQRGLRGHAFRLQCHHQEEENGQQVEDRLCCRGIFHPAESHIFTLRHICCCGSSPLSSALRHVEIGKSELQLESFVV
mmetsp:Transcript_33955/g.97820  ORF Transcript_33955/g.97820 Transcript_33955/m.97820 type:complete len:470 (+) Transcript_33955:778-2187(+)